MGLRVNTNSTSINAQRNLASVTEKLSGNFRRLSTGLRISSAADDAAGLAISERLRSQIRSLDQAKRNAMIAEAMKIHQDDVGHIPLHQQALAWAMKRNVDLVQLADNYMPLKWVAIKGAAQ